MEPLNDFPLGYSWLIEKKIIRFEPFSQMEPWFFMNREDCFWATERWDGVTDKKLYAFAKRQDNDDLACFLHEGATAQKVILIHGWTDSGFEILAEYQDIWEWLKSVIDDINEWTNS
jgi:hypothetical protein